MSRIKIKHFGPIKEGLTDASVDGWIKVSKTTVFIGNQGSGKSTIAKLISTFTWIEKALVRGDYDQKWFERKNKLKNQFLPYHRLENYFTSDTILEYEGKAYNISYRDNAMSIQMRETREYSLPQIMYVPSERNFLSYVKSPSELRLSSDSLKEFLSEFNNAKRNIKGLVPLPINNAELEYDRLNDTLNIRGDEYRLKLTDSSSGFQSLVPLFLVSEYLAKSIENRDKSKEKMNSKEEVRFKEEVKAIIANQDLTPEQKRMAISVLSHKFNKTSFVNIVEEPEQNLFPSSQWELLKSLLKFNNLSTDNKLILTTHSPYIINYLSIAIQASILKNKIKDNASLKEKLNSIVPLESTICSDEVSIYELDETVGTITKLGNYEGIPSDSNVLNKFLAEGNNLFDSLLEIEQLLWQ